MNNYWENRWQKQETGWDIGQASPALVAYVEQIPKKKRDVKILIPGCGNGHEAFWLLENGFTNVEMLDIAPTAVEAMRKRLDEHFPKWKQSLKLTCADFFEHEKSYELIIEQTFFCALHPSLREAYIEKMHELLKPKGKLVGLLFNRAFEGGPPFGGDIEEYKTSFSPFFSIKTLEPCYNSIPPRAGAEVFFIFQKK